MPRTLNVSANTLTIIITTLNEFQLIAKVKLKLFHFERKYFLQTTHTWNSRNKSISREEFQNYFPMNPDEIDSNVKEIAIKL
jgi:hypothetical protein